ncbi:hypothetical protein PFTANZ_06333, partial [Plasmodium falciparum Tanzania (2000708)]
DKDYHYDTVTLKEEDSGTGGTKGQPPPASSDTPTLDSFIKRPPYFRYLEEWGQNFCKERKKRLEEVKKGCRKNSSGNDTFCSGDGHDCTENGNLRHHKMLEDPDCRDCHKECRKYRKWIDLKFEEFQKQKDKYQGEFQKLNGNSNNADRNETFYKQIQEHTTVDKFLKELKHCKDGQNNSEEKVTEEDKKNNKIDFDKPKKTFSRSTYCETCPPNKVNCNGRRGQDPCTPDNGNKWEKVFGTISENGEKTTINVEMIDRRGPYIEEYMQEDSKNSKNSKNSFKTSRLFKGLRVQNWKCKFNNDQKMDVCHLINFNKDIDLNKYTTFKVLLIYWLEDFLYSYYILKKKIELCTQNKKQTCSEQSKNYCACVKEWFQQKTTEWDQIKKYYDDNFKTDGEHIYSRINSFFEQQLFDSGIKKDKQKVTNLSDLEKSVGCNCPGTSKKGEDADKKDIVECIHENLEKKIEECTSQSSGSDCTTSPTSLEEDDDYIPLEENPVDPPKICPQLPKPQPEAEDEDACKPAAEEPATAESGEQTPKEVPQEPESPKKEVTKKEKTKPKRSLHPTDDPWEPLKNAMLSSTIMWSVGIGFAAFTYFYLK